MMLIFSILSGPLDLIQLTLDSIQLPYRYLKDFFEFQPLETMHMDFLLPKNLSQNFANVCYNYVSQIQKSEIGLIANLSQIIIALLGSLL